MKLDAALSAPRAGRNDRSPPFSGSDPSSQGQTLGSRVRSFVALVRMKRKSPGSSPTFTEETRAALGEALFTTLHAEGRQWTTEQTLAEATTPW